MVTVRGDRAHFRFFRPRTTRVALVGDFNGWRTGELQMTPSGDGYWLAVMKLPPGSYKFRYCADGQWHTDYAAFGLEYGRFGFDSIVRVAPAPLYQGQPNIQSRDREDWADQPLMPQRAPHGLRAVG